MKKVKAYVPAFFYDLVGVQWIGKQNIDLSGFVCL
jgi:hypothetical protein